MPDGSYRASRYNFALEAGDRTVLYNARTGSVVTLMGKDGRLLAGHLCEFESMIDADQVGADTLSVLHDGGFVIDETFDEIAAISDAYWEARKGTPMVLTVTTTMDCNLGCYYCYEPRTGDQLEATDINDLVELTRARLVASGRASLHVDWYGGEPLLNIAFMEDASVALQRMCSEIGVTYHASIISNGTVWPDDVGAFVTRHRLRQIQISFDGLEDRHNRSRRYRAGYEEDAAGTFGRLWDLVDRLLDHTRVDVRINLDERNRGDLLPFVERARAAGWFHRKYAAVIQPARLSAFSEKSAFMRRVELSPERYDAIRADLRANAGEDVKIEESEAPDGTPDPKNSVCAALAADSVVVGADRLLYRCGLQVGETHRAVGSLAAPESDFPDTAFWRDFDPTAMPQCAHCSFLPVCWSGCPKKHLEGDAYAVAEQGFYWRQNLPRLIANTAGVELTQAPYTEREQFRDGYVPASPPRRCIPLTPV